MPITPHQAGQLAKCAAGMKSFSHPCHGSFEMDVLDHLYDLVIASDPEDMCAAADSVADAALELRGHIHEIYCEMEDAE